tara:strand:+ start:587 stop:1111 length:525 start_codon:yes stop_codon:yes gene_type:complete
MKIPHIRLLCTGLLCLSCIFVCTIQKSRINQAKQQIKQLQTLNWQNQQLNQYIAHRILLAPHREPLGLSQWEPNETKSESFCRAVLKELKSPTEWTTIFGLDEPWERRLSLTPWLESFDKHPQLLKSMKAANLKIKALPSWSDSLCTLEISTKISDSTPLATVIKFTNRKKTGA